MAGTLADQMMRKRERELKKRYSKYILLAVAMGTLFGAGMTTAVMLPTMVERDDLSAAAERQDVQIRDCQEELDFWRHAAPRRGGLDWTRCMWALDGCTRERDQLFGDLERCEQVTGYIYESEPFNNYFLYDWQGVEPAEL
jgi:hypothetical protein